MADNKEKERNENKGFENRQEGKFQSKDEREKKENKKRSGQKRSGAKSYNPGQKNKQDPEWYSVSNQLLQDTADIPFNIFPGTRERVVENVVTGATYSFKDASSQCTPGILTVRYACSPGYSENGTSAINVASKALYTWVRHRNSGRTNYESVDLMLYILSMDEIYTAWLEARRIYQLTMSYDVMNRNIPDALLRSLNIDADDIRANLAQFRARLNLQAAKMSAMAVPKAFNVFKRHAFIASNIFVDSTSRTSQYYIFQRDIGRTFSPTSSGGGSLVAHSVNSFPFTTRRTSESILNEIDTMLDVVLSDEDMNIMSGDIVKAFGGDSENLYILKEIAENEVASILFNEDVLAQIHNAITAPNNSAMADVTSMNITQSGGYVKFTGPSYQMENGDQLLAAYNIYRGNVYFNSHKDQPTPVDSMEWSRLQANIISDLEKGIYYMEYSSEYLIRFGISEFDYSTGTLQLTTTNLNTVVQASKTNYKRPFELWSVISKFDWHPILYLTYIDEDTTAPRVTEYKGVAADLKRYTLVSNNTRQRLNDLAIMGLYGSLMLQKLRTASSNKS